VLTVAQDDKVATAVRDNEASDVVWREDDPANVNAGIFMLLDKVNEALVVDEAPKKFSSARKMVKTQSGTSMLLGMEKGTAMLCVVVKPLR